MARFIGLACKKTRRIGSDLMLKQSNVRDLNSKCKLAIAPGQHGAKRKKGSDYALQLTAKQMLKYMYGVLEKQFRLYYEEASRKKGATGEVLLQLLETRLDNVAYRMGFATTRAEARQLVSHGAIEVAPAANQDKKRVQTIPSFQIKAGDVIKIRDKAKMQIRIKDALDKADQIGFSDWVRVEKDKMSGVFARIPERSDLPAEINEQLVVELYSK